MNCLSKPSDKWRWSESPTGEPIYRPPYHGIHVSLFAFACRSALSGGQGRIRTFEGVSQQIYSLPRLTTSVPTLKVRGQGICRGLLTLKPKISG